MITSIFAYKNFLFIGKNGLSKYIIHKYDKSVFSNMKIDNTNEKYYKEIYDRINSKITEIKTKYNL